MESNPLYINADETPFISARKPSDEWIDKAVKDLLQQLRDAGLILREAGITLVFGTSPTSSVGKRNAAYFVEFVIPKLRVFRNSATRAFWGGSANSGQYTTSSGLVEGEIDNGLTLDFYLMTTPKDDPLPATTKPDCG